VNEPDNGGQGEARLLEKAREGDGEAFDRLIAVHTDRIFGLLLNLTGSREEAEDLAQECFLRAYRALGSFRGGSAFYTWLYRIAVNLARSSGRRKVRRREVEVPMSAMNATGHDAADGDSGFEFAASVEAPGEAMHRAEMIARVREALEDIKREHREVVVLRDMEGLDYEQIARLVGISREAVKSRLHRARGELASRLKEMGCAAL
jgi:RNA polymerase sigma-70 factor (ECF subfamily)